MSNAEAKQQQRPLTDSYHSTGMQQHIWMVADKLCVLSETQNPIPAFLLQVFNHLVTQYMPVSQELKSLKY